MKCILRLLSLLLLAGCVQSNLSTDEEIYADRIHFGAAVWVNTRKPVESDENDLPLKDVYDIQILRGADGSTPGFDRQNNVSATANLLKGELRMAVEPIQTFNARHEDAHFMAFYPKPINFTAGLATYNIDGSQDIMTALPQTAVYHSARTINFTFNHQLVWIELRIIAKDEATVNSYGKLIEASVTVPNQLELTIASDGTAQLGKKENSRTTTLQFTTPIELSAEGQTSDDRFMIYPDANDLTHINLTFEKKKPKAYEIYGLELIAGKKTIIEARVNAQTVEFTVDVMDWEPGNGNGKDITIDPVTKR